MTSNDAPAKPAEDMPQLIALRKLKPSAANVRGKGSKADDEQLAADIAAHGVLQNLVVIDVGDGGFEVVAGARRLRALKILEKRKVIDGDFMVPCAVRAADQASEISLAENVQRVAMNPADEAVAFGVLAGGGADPAAIAARFGVTERHVRGRLRLAELAPVVLDALRKGKITLDQAQAYGCVPNPERQAEVFADLSRGYYDAPDEIRRRMRRDGIEGKNGLAIFVGRDAYTAAGGGIEEDLFTPDSEALWTDVELLKRLATDKLLPIAQAWRDRDGWLDVRVAVDHAGGEGLEWSGWVRTLPEADRGKFVVFLCVGSDGEPGLHAAAYSVIGAEADEDDADAGDADEEVEVRTLPAAAPAEPQPEPETLGGKVYDELAMQRRDLLRAALLGNDDLVADWMTFCLVDRDAGREWSDVGSTLRGRPEDGPVRFYGDATCPWGSPDWDGFEAKLDRSWEAPDSMAARFAAFHALDEAARADWQLYAALQTMTASSAVEPASPSAVKRQRDVHDVLAQLIALDPADAWRPTEANYFDRIPAGEVKAAIAEMIGREPEACGKLLTGKKAELSARAAQIAAGDPKAAEAWQLTPEEVARARRWVPAAMRFRKLLPEAGDDSAPALDVAAE